MNILANPGCICLFLFLCLNGSYEHIMEVVNYEWFIIEVNLTEAVSEYRIRSNDEIQYQKKKRFQ